MLLRQFRLGNNLLAHIKENTDFHIKENTDFLRQKPRQLPSAEANFEGRCVVFFFRRQKQRPIMNLEKCYQCSAKINA